MNAMAAVGGGGFVILAGKKLEKLTGQENKPISGFIFLAVGVLLSYFARKQKNTILEHAGHGGVAIGGLVALNRFLKKGTADGPLAPVLSGVEEDGLYLHGDSLENYGGMEEDYYIMQNPQPSPMRGKYFN